MAVNGVPTDRRRSIIIAHHEAGHCVAAYRLGIPFVYVTTKAQEGVRDGGVYFGPWPLDLGKNAAPERHDAAFRHWWGHAIVCLAGPEAERATVSEWPTPPNKTHETWGYDAPRLHGWYGDFCTARYEILKRMYGAEFAENRGLSCIVGDDFMRVRTEAEALVTDPRNFAAVRSVAAALIAQATLSHKEVVAVIEGRSE